MVLKAKSLLITLTGLTVEACRPAVGDRRRRRCCRSMPSFSICGVMAAAARGRDRDADAGVDDVVLVDQDVGIRDRRRRPRSG